MHRRQALFVIASVGCAASSASACLWDTDTLQMERQRFPETLELITGKFLRHSREFYEWRIQNRLKRLETDSNNLALLDDLAVAYEKTGLSTQAIETALRADKIQPGRYETKANLGTFYLHAGRFDEGLKEIEAAIAINPKAHFGREVSQKLLAEYVRSKKNGTLLPLPLSKEIETGSDPTGGFSGRKATTTGFARFVIDARPKGKGEVQAIQDARKGVLGMMKFGNHDSPVLLEALGDLLIAVPLKDKLDAKNLAARAYLRASYQAKDASAQATYRSHSNKALAGQAPTGEAKQLGISDLETIFKTELADAERWFQTVAEDERRWIAEGVDADAAFAKKYYRNPRLP